MNKVKKQHYVPQFYLRQWHNDKSSEQIYVYNKEKQKSYSTNIKDIASSNYFYDLPKLNEEQLIEYIEYIKNDTSYSAKENQEYIDNIALLDGQLMEKYLSEIEAINSPILNSIITRLNNIKALPLKYFYHQKFIKEEEIFKLSTFIALQYLRTEEMRILLDHNTKLLEKYISDITLKKIDHLEHRSDNFNEFRNDETYKKLAHLDLIFELEDKIANYLINYQWIILINNTNMPFITTDNLVVLKSNLKNHENKYEYGFRTKGIEIYFPISPNYAISIFEPSYFRELIHDLNKSIFELKENDVVRYNDLLIIKATSQIYSNINNFSWVEKRIKDTPYVADKTRKRVKISKF